MQKGFADSSMWCCLCKPGLCLKVAGEANISFEFLPPSCTCLSMRRQGLPADNSEGSWEITAPKCRTPNMGKWGGLLGSYVGQLKHGFGEITAQASTAILSNDLLCSLNPKRIIILLTGGPRTYLRSVGDGGMGYNYNYYYYHSSIPY